MPRKNRKVTALKIDEISGVGRPAQEGAVLAIMKRAPGGGPRPTRKAGDLVRMVTGDANGHQHHVQLYGNSDSDELGVYVSYEKGTDEEGYGHNHKVIDNGDGTYGMSTALGHTHPIDSEKLASLMGRGVTKGDVQMSTKATKTAEELNREIDELRKRADRSDAIVKLSAEHREYFDGLSDESADKFLAKSADERDALIAEATRRANEDDPVVYKTSAGVEIRESDGPTVLALAKSGDAQATELADTRKKLAKAERANTDADLRKRAETEFEFLPGSVETRIELIKAAESIDDEDARKKALDALKAQNEAMSKAFRTYGTSAIPVDDDSAEGELEKLTKAYAKEHDVTPEVAQTEVLKTARGQELYAASTVN